MVWMLTIEHLFNCVINHMLFSMLLYSLTVWRHIICSYLVSDEIYFILFRNNLNVTCQPFFFSLKHVHGSPQNFNIDLYDCEQRAWFSVSIVWSICPSFHLPNTLFQSQKITTKYIRYLWSPKEWFPMILLTHWPFICLDQYFRLRQMISNTNGSDHQIYCGLPDFSSSTTIGSHFTESSKSNRLITSYLQAYLCYKEDKSFLLALLLCQNVNF